MDIYEDLCEHRRNTLFSIQTARKPSPLLSHVTLLFFCVPNVEFRIYCNNSLMTVWYGFCNFYKPLNIVLQGTLVSSFNTWISSYK